MQVQIFVLCSHLGKMMKNSVHPIIIGYWNKGGNTDAVHCHFDEGENASNAFCIEREKERPLPKDLLAHIIKHFTFEYQWVLDITNSKGEEKIHMWS